MCCLRSREDEVTEILVGTKKGLFVLQGDDGAGFSRRSRRDPPLLGGRNPFAPRRRSVFRLVGRSIGRWR